MAQMIPLNTPWRVIVILHDDSEFVGALHDGFETPEDLKATLEEIHCGIAIGAQNTFYITTDKGYAMWAAENIQVVLMEFEPDE